MENGVSDLRSQFDPAQPEDSPEMPAAFEADNAPTMTVDLPEDMSFSDSIRKLIPPSTTTASQSGKTQPSKPGVTY